ncbi:MAG TPA: MATE family efflux transporter [Gammaproteobacteria bacterium]|nr:MATE family efflux transporter [Gammaproteobacteria bacterium]
MNHERTPTRADLLALLRLAAPIVLIQVGMMLMGVVDTIMVGGVSAAALAAAALGNLYFWIITALGVGVLMALDPIVAQALGARDEVAVTRGVQRGLLLAVLLAIPLSLALSTVGPVLEAVREPEEVVPAAAGYVHRAIPGLWPMLAFVALRQTLQAHRRTAPIVVTIVLANLLNGLLNYLWIYGHWGFPALGVLGSAWATTVSRWCMAVLLVVLGWQQLERYFRRLAPGLFDLRALGRMLKIGGPIGAQMMVESGVFGTVALLMGWLGVVQVAAHQVAINLASLTFMVPLGVSSAAAVIVGHAVGRGDPAAVRRGTRAALAVGAGFMALMAAVLIAVPGPLARLYTADPNVLALTVVLLPIAGVFQVFDGLQVVSLGLLRGLGDTRVPVIAGLAGFWGIGMPVSLVLGFVLDYGAAGLWWGLVVGLVAVASFLLLRVLARERRDLERIIIDEHAKPEIRADAAEVLAK